MKAKQYLKVMGIGVMAALMLTACSGKKAGAKEGAVNRAEQETLAAEEPGAGSQAAEGPGAGSQAAEYVKLKPEEAKARIDSGDKIVIVDVRTPEEYGESHIGNAINIPVEEIGTEKPEALPDTEAEIMVYCRSGVRSKQAAVKLLELGYKNIRDIGGIKDWPYETVAGDDIAADDVTVAGDEAGAK